MRGTYGSPNPPNNKDDCPEQSSDCASNLRIPNAVECTFYGDFWSEYNRCEYPSRECADSAGRTRDCYDVGKCPEVPRGVMLPPIDDPIADPQVCRSPSGLICHYNSWNEAEAAGDWKSWDCQPRSADPNPGREHDCYTWDRHWSDFKRRWCCNNKNLGCDGPTIG